MLVIARRMLVAALIPRLFESPRPARALIGEPTADDFLQSDDKSWDITLPRRWRVSEAAPRAEHPAHLFRVEAARDGAPDGPRLEVLVDKLKKGGTSLADLGKLPAVAERYLAKQPQPAELVDAALVPGAIRGSSYYQMSYRVAGGKSTSTVKLGLQQGRLYALEVVMPDAAAADVRSEADAIVSSFKVFPVNMICIGQSNKGTVPVPGSCY